MEVLGSAPWLAVVLLSLAAALAVLEAAVPGFGLAGGAAAVCVVVAGVVVAGAEVPWWPLLLVGTAVVVWTLMVWWQRAPVAAQAGAAGLAAAGGVGFGILADDPASVVVGVVGPLGLAVGFPALHGWARRLAERQPTTGMEALVGRVAVVERVPPDDRLAVRLDGSLWTIAPVAPVGPGTPVVVTGWRGMVLAVEPAPVPPGVPSGPS